MIKLNKNLIVFEGIDGCGKDTQMELLKDALIEQGKKVIIVSNITDGPTGKLIREVLNKDNDLYVNNRQIACLFLSELHNVAKAIISYINDGYVVLCSRWWHSTLAYAGTKYNDFQAIKSMIDYDIEPRIVFYINISPSTAIARIKARDDKKEIYDDIDKLTNISRLYKEVISHLGRLDAPHVVVVNGEKSIESIHKNILEELEYVEDDTFSNIMESAIIWPKLSSCKDAK